MPVCHSFHAVVDAIAHVDIKPPSLPKQGFVAGAAAAIPVAGGVVLGIRLRFHNHPPKQLATCLALHQQAADQLRRHFFCGAAEKDSWQRREVLDGRGSYGGRGAWSIRAYRGTKHQPPSGATELLTDCPAQSLFCSPCKPLPYYPTHLWQYHDCCRPQHF